MSKIGEMDQQAFFGQLHSTINSCVEAKLKPISEQVAKHDDKLQELGAQCAEALKLARGVVVSDGSGAVLGSSTKATARDGNKRFVADHVLIKGFAAWENRKVSGIDRPSAEQLLEKVASVVPSVTKEHMLFSKMNVVGGGKSDTIHLPVTPGFADEVQGDMVAALDKLEFTFSGRIAD